MPCFHPITAYQSVHADGPQSVHFGERPRAIATRKIKLPCNHCTGCRTDHGAEWGLRLALENQMHEISMFITPTYNDDKLPIDYGLHKDHFQKFIRRFRKYLKKNHPGTKIRYFETGEYGEKTSRPHFHALIFGFRFDDEQWFDGEKEHQYTMSEMLNSIWGKGNVIIADVTPESCNYVARYMLKDLRTNNWKNEYEIANPETGEIHQRIPPFSTMSTKPAIGKTWYDKYKSDCFPSGYIIHNGTKHPIPAYFLKLLAKDDPEEYLRQNEIRRLALTDPKHRWNSTPDRLLVRETCALARVQNLTRDKV